jgi:hypothetical protein
MAAAGLLHRHGPARSPSGGTPKSPLGGGVAGSGGIGGGGGGRSILGVKVTAAMLRMFGVAMLLMVPAFLTLRAATSAPVEDLHGKASPILAQLYYVVEVWRDTGILCGG